MNTKYHKKVGKLFHRGWEKAYGNNWYKEKYGWKSMEDALTIERKNDERFG